ILSTAGQHLRLLQIESHSWRHKKKYTEFFFTRSDIINLERPFQFVNKKNWNWIQVRIRDQDLPKSLDPEAMKPTHISKK
ncbi:MAG: hypothetical protein ACK53Y_06695, partial [bacterium]